MPDVETVNDNPINPVDLGYACIMCEGTDGELVKISSPRAWRIHLECCDTSGEVFNG